MYKIKNKFCIHNFGTTFFFDLPIFFTCSKNLDIYRPVLTLILINLWPKDYSKFLAIDQAFQKVQIQGLKRVYVEQANETNVGTKNASGYKECFDPTAMYHLQSLIFIRETFACATKLGFQPTLLVRLQDFTATIGILRVKFDQH